LPIAPNDIIQKHSRDEAAAMSDLLPGITDGLKKAVWKVGVFVCVHAYTRACDTKNVLGA